MTEDPIIYGTPEDLPFLFDFLHELTHATIQPRQHHLVADGECKWWFSILLPRSSNPPPSTPVEYVDTTPADLSTMPNLKKLEIDHCLVARFTGFNSVQNSLIMLR